MGPTGVSNNKSPEITQAEIEANASLIEAPPRLESRATDAAPAPLPPGAQALVDKHSAASARAALAPPKDWCGSKGTEWVPEGLRGTNWADACKTHDECYGTPGANKYLCDFGLQQDISLDCAAQGGGPACQLVAGAYYQAVQWFGGTAYENAQAEAAAKGKP